MGARLLVETLEGLVAGTIVPEAQDAAQATYAPMLKKEDGRIDWTRDAAAVHNQVRGLQPSPGAYTQFRGQTLHVRRSRVVQRSGSPGMVASVKPLVVACGTGALELIEVQSEGRKRLSAADFANGQRLIENERLG
jgi:methionyl-tRNA formyltransferase